MSIYSKIICKASYRDHATPLLKSLHWLPIEQPIKFKMLVITFSCIKATAPEYLCHLVTYYQPTKTLRSGSLHQLTEYRTNNKYGDRCFKYAAPVLWNDIPIDLKTQSTSDNFKKSLKPFCLRNIIHDLYY